MIGSIDTINLTKKIGDVTAVDGPTFHVDEGEAFGFQPDYADVDCPVSNPISDRL